jgi:hypothetical protein
MARTIAAVPLNSLAHKLAEAAGVTVGSQLVQSRKVFPAVARLKPEVRPIRLLSLIALWILRGGRRGIANDELIDRKVELFTPRAELILL